MPAESVERRAPAKSTAGMPPPPPEQEHLPCPRCDSTNTKFCYYNNYNLSQPRHFCKSCRRYWTQGGTLRDIPVGGGTRKNAKRSRTLPPTTSSTTDTVHVSSASGAAPFLGHSGALGLVPSVAGSFTSLLNASGSGSGGSGGFLALGGLGLGIDDSGLGPLSRAMWAFPEVTYNGNGVGGTWQMESGGEQGIGSFVGGDCFSCWPELAISTPGNALK